MRQKRSAFFPSLLAIAVVAGVVLMPSASMAERYLVLHEFAAGWDGANPYSGLVVDAAGNLYGTTLYGGDLACGGGMGTHKGCGTVFRLTKPTVGGWKETILHTFSGADGMYPLAGLVFDGEGNLYGTTNIGGDLSCNSGNGCGTVFKLSPNADGSWTETVIHNFTTSPDGFEANSGLVFDASGNLYGTTQTGGLVSGEGTVFKLSPNSDGSWTETILHSFSGTDGSGPSTTPIFDQAGNLYGTTNTGGAFGCGAVYRLSPNSDGTWTEAVLFSFNSTDGNDPYGGLVFDKAGNLYGATMMGGSIYNCSGHCGLVYELSPTSNGSWKETIIHMFGLGTVTYPSSTLTFDAAGNLYGTAFEYAGNGAIYKLSPSAGGKWAYSTPYAFNALPAWGPLGPVVFDKSGTMYGTTVYCGGTFFCNGVAFEITP